MASRFARPVDLEGAGRPKDREFCRASLQEGYVDRVTLTTRLSAVAGLNPALVRSVEDMTSA